MANSRVLLIDDDLSWGELLVSVLERRGYPVAWFVRARLVDDAVVLMAPAGTETALNPADYDIALIDGRLKGSFINGWELTPHVVALGLSVIGLSGAHEFNTMMLKAGATRATLKEQLFSELLEGKLPL